jgi:hypothetical protein
MKLTADVIHLNSMFSKITYAHPIANCSIAKHPSGVRAKGNAGRGCCFEHQAIEKRMFLSVARMMDLFRVSHGTHPQRKKRRKSVCISFRHMFVAQNLPSTSGHKPPTRPTDRWKIVVIGRIHRVKNLDFGLKALLEGIIQLVPWNWTFIGPVEDEGYQKELPTWLQHKRG